MTVPTIDITAATPIASTLDGTATAPTLSLCIPTYNRADFLDYLLTHIARDCTFDFPFEVVISDNASTDNTTEVVEKHRSAGMDIRYYRQPENKGSLPNYMTALHRARGRYVMYLADDDLLIPEALASTVAFLLANPDVVASYSPWEMYDDLNKVASGNFYDIDKEVIFQPGEEMDLLSLIIENHIFPETVIYRADAMRKIVGEPKFCFWAFSYLANLTAIGPVAFRTEPYYRSVTGSSVAPNRAQAGNQQAMTDWDSYRGGLEYFIYVALSRSGITLNADTKRAFRDLVDAFIETRMRVALRLWMAQGDCERVYELICRLHYLDPASAAQVPQVEKLPLLILAQMLARFANGIADVDRVLLQGVEDGQSVASLMRETGLARHILVSPLTDKIGAHLRQRSIVFLAQESERQRLVEQGFLPGLIIGEADLMASVYLPV